MDCKIIHRDISSGNILIYPTTEQIDGKNAFRVVWRGILIDWELSKPTIDCTDGRVARQPERTVRRNLIFIIPYTHEMAGHLE